MDIREALGAQRLAGERARHRHVWRYYGGGVPENDGTGMQWCRGCGVLRDSAQSRKGRSSRNRGNRRELELARALGGEKVGHFGGEIDVRSDLLAVQSKVRKAFPYWQTDELAKLPRTGGRIPVLIVTDSPGRGIERQSIVVLLLSDFVDLHGRVK